MSQRKVHPVEPAKEKPRPHWRLPWRWLIGAALLLVGGVLVRDWYVTLPATATATYVGRQTCLECHATQAEHWAGSDHDLAMDEATPTSVLGDFSGVEHTAFGVTSRFFRDGDRYLVRTEGPDGKLADFQVKYTFGVRPLQQYLVEFDRPANMPPHENARLQVLALSWDTEARRWFHLAPPDVKEKIQPGDDLHWTGPAFNWNSMCADCHSTNLEKRFDVKSRTFHTTFSEIDVSCETCHGPGSLHVDLAHNKLLFWDRERGYALPNLKSTDSRVEVETCAACHSRRRLVGTGFHGGHAYHDFFTPELLGEQTYFPDGQIKDEVYEYGSFVQSKMHSKGIRCTNCHDPHTLRPKHEGNKLCTSCHAHPEGKYDSPAHHHHQPGTTAAQCVECHMPGRHYMEVDFRRDHSLRIPRPDLSLETGSPNACTGCHVKADRLPAEKQAGLSRYAHWLERAPHDTEIQAELDRVNAWARNAVRQWYGNKREQEPHFAPILAAAWRGDPAIEKRLAEFCARKDVAPFVKASLTQQLTQFGGQHSELLAKLTTDADPAVRATAASQLGFLTPRDLRRIVAPLLADGSRWVRTEAARVLVTLPPHELEGSQRELLRTALGELTEGLLAMNDRAGAHVALGGLYEQMNNFEQAQQAYRTALFVEPNAVGARANLAQLFDREAERIEGQMRQTGTAIPAQLWREVAANREKQLLESQRLRIEESALLARDVKLAPHLWQVRYDYGRLLDALGDHAAAERELLHAAKLNSYAVPVAESLVLNYRRQRKWNEARTWVAKLRSLRPELTAYAELAAELDLLERQEGSPPK